jgi:site-specific recombinase XerD
MNINFPNGIIVNYNTKIKINKTNVTKYDIYIQCQVYQNGIMNGYASVGTGISVPKSEWNDGKQIGRNTQAQLVNNTLNDYLIVTKTLLTELMMLKISTCSELVDEIKSQLRLRLLGKPPKGKKKEFMSKLESYHYQFTMEKLWNDRNLSITRRRGYQRGYELLKGFYHGRIPTIDQITMEDLERFRKFIGKRLSNQNTITDYCSKIAAVIKYALKLKIISQSPLPDGFRGSWKNSDRPTLSMDECMSIINLNDSELTNTLMVSKYCLLIQLLTGIGYADLKSIEYKHIKYNSDVDRYYIEKERNKTGQQFKVYLTDKALECVTKLIELTGTLTTPFQLPSIDYINRIYGTIQDMCGIRTKITTYTLRHSYAVHYMEHDGRLEDLQKMLGHSNIKTTQIYGRINDKRLSDKMKELQSKSLIHQSKNQNKDQLKKMINERMDYGQRIIKHPSYNK